MSENVVYILQTRDGFRVATQIDIESIYTDTLDIFDGGISSGNFCEDALWKSFEEASFFEDEQDATEYAQELLTDLGINLNNLIYLRYPDLDFPENTSMYNDLDDIYYTEELNFDSEES
jgi:hypothetical protein